MLLTMSFVIRVLEELGSYELLREKYSAYSMPLAVSDISSVCLCSYMVGISILQSYIHAVGFLFLYTLFVLIVFKEVVWLPFSPM